ncbi:MAG: hypothetical protein J5802_02385 [Butyrivibrio sp.]|nr:hypothetical protein [Butyrivibrio sp.]
MKKAVVILDGLFVYLFLCMIACLFAEASSDMDIVDYMKIVFRSGAVLGVITIIWTIANCLKSCMIEPKEAVSLAKLQMILRLVQIPAYIVIFLLGVILVFTFFGLVMAMILAVIDGISIALTGTASIAVYAHLLKNNLITKKQFIGYSILSYIYVLDVIASILCYTNVKRKISSL